MYLPAGLKEWVPTPVMRMAKRVLGRDRYDRPTRLIIRECLQAGGNAVDIGANRGDMLDSIVKFAPDGKHMAFEPIPELADRLRRRFPNVAIHEIALSDDVGEVEFYRVVGHEDYSGFRKRQYPGDWKTTVIKVQRSPLTDVWPVDRPLHFIKIDVEGAQLEVLRGAKPLLSRWHPVVVFEHGIGAVKTYGTTPDHVFDLLASCGLSVWPLDAYLARLNPLNQTAFRQQCEQSLNFYFVSGPP